MSFMGDSIDKLIGLSSIAKNYGWKDFFMDSIVPIILALLVLVTAAIFSDDSRALFDKIVALGISILPSYLGLLVAAYTILLTLLTTPTVEKLKQIEDAEHKINGKDLIRLLNMDFAVCILITGFALFLSFLFSVFSSLNIVFLYADVVNYLGLFLMVFLLAFSLGRLTDLIENLYNIGQTTTIL